ncbi:MAG: Fe(3+) ABC transporter substrate-binding protein [Candidatus Kapaibacteriales bacterium]
MFACGEKEEPSDEPTADNTKVVNVYSHRSYDVDSELYAAFEEETGIKVNVISDKADMLIEKLKMDAQSSDADLLITVDAARLYRAVEEGLLDSVATETLLEQVPENLIGGNRQWYALTKRARVLAYNPANVKAEELETWESITEDRFKGRISVRSSDNVYNQSLLAAMIASKGEEWATEWAKAVKKNMWSEPKGNDLDQMKNVAAGDADVAIVNTYYYGLLASSEDEAEREVADKIKLAFPVIPGGGVHVNVSGVGLLKNSPNRENAIKLMEYLTGGNAQKIYSEDNYEYPANPNAVMSKMIASWPPFEEDATSLDSLGSYNKAAVKIFDVVGWK